MSTEKIETWQRIDGMIQNLNNQMLIQIQQQLAKKKNLPTKELRELTACLHQIKRIQDETRGDSAKALLVLVSQGIIPVAAIPQILSALEKSETQINEDATKALKGGD